MRTAEEITMRCKLILNQPDIVALVDKSSSPTSRESGSLARNTAQGLSRQLFRAHPKHSLPRSEEHGKERRKT